MNEGEACGKAMDSREAAPPFVMAIDVGTSAVRSVLVDAHARVVTTTLARAPVRVRVSASGASEIDVAELAESVWGCVDATLERGRALASLGSSSKNASVRGVAIATFVSSVCGLDKDSRPITPLFTWADTRGEEDAARLRDVVPHVEVYERTGCPLHTSYLTVRLSWLRRTRPELFGRVARWMTIGEYLESQLFGRARCSFSVASWAGLLDRARLAWDGSLLDLLGISPGQLSPLVDVDEPASGLQARFRERWPELADVPWFPAIGDGAAHNLGSGAGDSRNIALALGTSGALRVVEQGDPHVIPGLWVYKVDRRRSLVGGALSEGGNILAWLTSLLRLQPGQENGREGVAGEAAWEETVAAMAPDSHSLTVLPFVAGERSPGWHPGARATITGMSLATTPEEIVRACLEAVAYRFAEIAARLPATGENGRTIIASGGASRLRVWLQILADVLGRPVVQSQEPEPTARGAALVAWRALGAFRDGADPPAATGMVFTPDDARHSRYLEGLARHRALYVKLMDDSAQRRGD
ncbi:MAG: gluconokinase [Bacillota bacterium]|nr:gluconokinase [Bacillota bacterium]